MDVIGWPLARWEVKGMCLGSEGSNGCAWVASGGGLGVKGMCLESEGSNGCAWVASGGSLGGQRNMLEWPPAGVGGSKGCAWVASGENLRDTPISPDGSFASVT